MRFLWFVTGIVLMACTEPDLHSAMRHKIDLFTQFENIYSGNITIAQISRAPGREEPMEFGVWRKGSPGFAVIQTKPDIRLLRNFYSDSITIDFVRAFAALDLIRLSNEGGEQNQDSPDGRVTYLEFFHEKKKVALFRGHPDRRAAELDDLVGKSNSLDGIWRFCILAKSSE